jgi:hypothetical protein
LAASNAAPIRAEIGSTVDEPEISIRPDPPVPAPFALVVSVESSPPQAATRSTKARSRGTNARFLTAIEIDPSLLSSIVRTR